MNNDKMNPLAQAINGVSPVAVQQQHSVAQRELITVFMGQMQAFEQATMNRLVAISEMKDNENQKTVLAFREAEAAHRQAAHELMNTYALTLQNFEAVSMRLKLMGVAH